MIFSQPRVKRPSRQNLRSVFVNGNVSRSLQTKIHIRSNQVLPKTEDPTTKINQPSTKTDQYQKRPLFRRVCVFLSAAIALVLMLATIAVIILLVIPLHSTSNATNNTSAANQMLQWYATGTTVAGTSSVSGVAANQLDRPFSIALDSSNTLYIADQQNNRIQRWAVGASSGTTLAGQSSGVFGSTASDFYQPSGILLDSSTNIYVTDTSNNRVQFWPNGASSGTTVAGTLGSAGNSNGELAEPYGIARDPTSGTLYMVDQSNHRVMQYLSGASSGTVVAGGNGPGTANTQLNLPVGLYLDSSSNSLIITNAGGNNIVRWVLGATSWTLVAGSITGINGETSTLLDYPMDVTLDSTGNVYVADRNNHRIQLFLAGQSNGTTIAGVSAMSGANTTMLYNPCSVALDAQLNLYVADTYNHRVQQFIRY